MRSANPNELGLGRIEAATIGRHPRKEIIRKCLNALNQQEEVERKQTYGRTSGQYIHVFILVGPCS